VGQYGGVLMHRTPTKVLLVVAAFALFLVPVAAIAAAGFTDVADHSVFVADIQWMKDNGITKGCNPPTNDRFCPGNNVTREQMSAFMHRLAINRVVDAGTVEGFTAAELKGQTGPAGPIGPAGLPGPLSQGPVNVHQSAFVPVDQSVEWKRSLNRLALPNGGVMIAPVVLPQGVAMTMLEVRVLADFDDQQMTVALTRVNKHGGASETLGSVAVVGSYEASVTRFEDVTISNAVVDNQAYWYVLRANFTADAYADYDLGFYGATIDYSLP
jgi:hypothetical protein